MPTPILATKLYIPPPRPKAVLRPHLLARLNEGLAAGRKLTLITAPAGFGKSTLVSAWVAGGARAIAWLSLDAGDNDPARFLAYLVAALQTLFAGIGAGVMAALESPQPPPTEPLLTALLNEIAAVRQEFILVLDDYHAIDAAPVDKGLAFLLEHQPRQMHLVIATREDPQLPLARCRARGQLTELRAADLRFTPAEAAEFLNQGMGLNLSADDIVALETRTEGWIAGLQLAALALQGTLSMQGHAARDTAGFIKSFTGTHRFVLDYLVEEVLGQQTARVQAFLLRTSILDRLCGPLCDAVLAVSTAAGQEVLEYLERANLFSVPLDSERRWYRYHHLFGDLLRQRLGQTLAAGEIAGLHVRASQWYEDHALDLEAFHHAAAADDIARAVRLMESKGMPLHLPGAATAVLNWLESLPTTVLNARPALWWKQAELLLSIGQTIGAEEKLQATEVALAAAALPGAALDDQTRDLIGRIAVVRAGLALAQHQAETILVQTRRALEYLRPDSLPYRCEAIQTMGYAHYLQGDRVAAGQAYAEALAIAQASGNMLNTILVTTNLGQIQQLENQLHRAAETYQRVLQLIGDYSPANAGVAYFGLARICYEWNDLDAAEQHGEHCLQLARQYNQFINRFIMCGVFLARLKLVRGDVDGATALLTQAEQSARQHNFVRRLPDVAAVQVLVLLRQGDLAAAAHLAETHALPVSQARVHLAQGDPAAALARLEPYRQQVETRHWQDERLKVMVLQSVALHAAALQTDGGKDKAVQLLGEVLALAEPGGFIRLFVDEGEPMRLLMADVRVWLEKQTRGQDQKRLGYVDRLLTAFPQPAAMPRAKVANLSSTMPEPLSPRELEILKLIAQGLSNREIGERLFLALDTVKGHNRRIFDKLQVQSRTEAIARAHESGLV
jgi:LuxR family maltose regulon positive regulatory protein